MDKSRLESRNGELIKRLDDAARCCDILAKDERGDDPKAAMADIYDEMARDIRLAVVALSEKQEPVGSFESGWNEAIQRALLACEGEQSKYKYENNCAKAVRGALEYAMFEIRGLKVPK